MDAAGAPVERCVVAEDAAVGGHLPVAARRRVVRDADDRLVQRLAAHRSEEGRVAEAEDAAVGGDQPVPLAVRGRGDADDRLVQPQGARGAVEGRITEAEDAAVGGDQPVALAVRRGGDADDRCIQLTAEGAVVDGRAEGGHGPVGLDLPVPGAVGRGGDGHGARARLDRGGQLTPAGRDVGRRRARADEDGSDGTARVARGREGRSHRQDRGPTGAAGELVEDDVAVTPAPRCVRQAARGVGRRRAAVAVVVHPVVVGLEHRGQAAGPDRSAEGDGPAARHRGREGRVAPRVGAGLRVAVELRRDVVDRWLAAIDALVVHDGEHLLVDGQSGERRLGDVHGAHAFLAARVVDRHEPVGVVRSDVGRRVGGREDAGGGGRCSEESGDDRTHEHGPDGQ